MPKKTKKPVKSIKKDNSKPTGMVRFCQAVKTLHPNQVKDKPGLALLCLTVFLLTVSLALIHALTAPKGRPPEVLQAGSGASLLFEPGSPNLIKIVANYDPIDPLDPATSQYGVAGSVQLNLNTSGASIYGTDAMINFGDPLVIDGITPNTSTSLKTFAPVVDADNDTSFDWPQAVDAGARKIEFGAVTFNFGTSAPTNAYNGNTSLATINFKTNKIRKRINTNFSLVAQNGQTTESNIVNTSLNDILTAANVNTATVHVLPEPVCRAALYCSSPPSPPDNIVGLNDLMYILPKYNTDCTNCDEDLTDDGHVSILDLMFIAKYYTLTCSVNCP